MFRTHAKVCKSEVSKRMLFSNLHHSISKNPGTWLSTAITRGNKTISLQSTLLTWAKASDQSVRVIDSCLGVMCNPTCPDKLAFVDTAVHWSEVPNGMVVFLSLLVTVVCVVVKSSFVVQSALLARARRRYLESQESLKVKYFLVLHRVVQKTFMGSPYTHANEIRRQHVKAPQAVHS